jgi:hypothetical protein
MKPPGDDALAFIMAHEITHVTRRHGMWQMEKSLAVGTLLELTVGPNLTSGVLQLAMDMHYSRHDETEADRLGLELMSRAGFDPGQGAEAMAVIARVAKAGRRLPAFLRSHPLPESRIAALRRQAAALRAAPPPARATTAAPPLPPLPPLPPPPAVAATELFPLAPGMRWTYRVTGRGEPLSLVTTVLEEQPGQPGVYRVRTELDSGLATTRFVVVSKDQVCVCPQPDDGERVASQSAVTAPRQPTANQRRQPSWRPELSLPADHSPERAAMETVRVPAGQYSAVRAMQRGPGGETATVWLVPRIGVVRRTWERSGLVEELEAVYRPAPDGSRKVEAGEREAASKELPSPP